MTMKTLRFRIRFVAMATAVGLVFAAGCGDLVGPRDRDVTMDVASERVPCQGAFPQECLQVREHPSTAWTLFYDGIEGFDFEPGFDYTIRVRVREIPNPPQDGSSRAYRLLAILKKVPA